jgi:hypothetical protein
METDAMWKPWKSKLRFPTVSTTLGKLEKGLEFPTVPTASTTGYINRKIQEKALPSYVSSLFYVKGIWWFSAIS